MSKFSDILKNKKYPELSGYLSENMSVKETVKGSRYSALITTKDSTRALRTTINESSMLVTIFDGNEVLEKYVSDYSSDEELDEKIRTAVGTYEAIDDIEDFDIDDEDGEETVLTEEPSKFSSVEMGLVSVRDSVVSVADDVKDLSDMTNDIEMTTIVMDIANTLYGVALDIEDAIDTYHELKAEDSDVPEDMDDSVDVESVKASLRRSVVQLRKLGNKELSESCKKFIRGIESLS